MKGIQSTMTTGDKSFLRSPPPEQDAVNRLNFFIRSISCFLGVLYFFIPLDSSWATHEDESYSSKDVIFEKFQHAVTENVKNLTFKTKGDQKKLDNLELYLKDAPTISNRGVSLGLDSSEVCAIKPLASGNIFLGEVFLSRNKSIDLEFFTTNSPFQISVPRLSSLGNLLESCSTTTAFINQDRPKSDTLFGQLGVNGISKLIASDIMLKGVCLADPKLKREVLKTSDVFRGISLGDSAPRAISQIFDSKVLTNVSVIPPCGDKLGYAINGLIVTAITKVFDEICQVAFVFVPPSVLFDANFETSIQSAENYRLTGMEIAPLDDNEKMLLKKQFDELYKKVNYGETGVDLSDGEKSFLRSLGMGKFLENNDRKLLEGAFDIFSEAFKFEAQNQKNQERANRFYELFESSSRGKYSECRLDNSKVLFAFNLTTGTRIHALSSPAIHFIHGFGDNGPKFLSKDQVFSISVHGSYKFYHNALILQNDASYYFNKALNQLCQLIEEDEYKKKLIDESGFTGISKTGFEKQAKESMLVVDVESQVDKTVPGAMQGWAVNVASNDTLSVRSGPGVDFTVIARLQANTKVQLSGELKRNGSTDWLEIMLPEHIQKGWVSKKFISQLPKEGQVGDNLQRKFLGVQTADHDIKKTDGLNLKEHGGALVTMIISDSPAERAGIKVNDVIIQINGQEVIDSSSVLLIVSVTRPGIAIPIGILRNGKPITVTAVLENISNEALAVRFAAGQGGAHSNGATNNSNETGSLPGERFPQTRQQLLDESMVGQWTEDEIRYALNEMFARYGATFYKTPEIQQHFDRMSWYHRREGVSFDAIEAEFNDYERQNIVTIGSVRNKRKASR